MEQEKVSGYQYQICVEEHIGAGWIDWPCSVEIQHMFDPKRLHPVTQVSVRLPDQPALYGLLEKFRDLNLKLVSIQREEMESICQK